MNTDDTIKFKVYDGLLKRYIFATGKVLCNVYGKLWGVQPDKDNWLSGIPIIIHEDNMN